MKPAEDSKSEKRRLMVISYLNQRWPNWVKETPIAEAVGFSSAALSHALLGLMKERSVAVRFVSWQGQGTLQWKSCTRDDFPFVLKEGAKGCLL